MNLYDRIEKLCQYAGITVTEMCRQAGISRTVFSELKSGRSASISQKNIKKLADYFNVSADSIMGNEIANYYLLPITRKRFRVLGEIACGKPIFANEDHESYIEASSHIEADFCLVARGDSMINARIYDGDVVFIKQQEMVANGQIAAVIIDDEATLKRWYYYPEEHRLVLMPENSKYAPLIFTGEELNHIICLGRAVCFMSNL